jgi:hypothetical protein
MQYESFIQKGLKIKRTMKLESGKNWNYSACSIGSEGDNYINIKLDVKEFCGNI